MVIFVLDEQALLKGAQSFGYVFHTRTPKSVSISALGIDEEYEVLNVIEFTSARKRMSVIVRNPNKKIYLYCKVSFWVICKIVFYVLSVAKKLLFINFFVCTTVYRYMFKVMIQSFHVVYD